MSLETLQQVLSTLGRAYALRVASTVACESPPQVKLATTRVLELILDRHLNSSCDAPERVTPRTSVRAAALAAASTLVSLFPETVFSILEQFGDDALACMIALRKHEDPLMHANARLLIGMGVPGLCERLS
jgi:hypothetical protein